VPKRFVRPSTSIIGSLMPCLVERSETECSVVETSLVLVHFEKLEIPRLRSE